MYIPQNYIVIGTVVLYASLIMLAILKIATTMGEKILERRRASRTVANTIPVVLAAQPIQPRNEIEDVLGEALYWLDVPFAGARTVLILLLALVPAMFVLNIYGYGKWNFGFSVLVVLLAIKVFVRWYIVLAAMGLGWGYAFFASTKEKQFDLTVGALNGLRGMLRGIAGTFVVVLLLSIVTAIVPWANWPMSFWLLLIGFSGMFLYSFANSFKSVRWVQHIFIFGIFIAVIVMGVMPIFGLTAAGGTSILQNIWTSVLKFYHDPSNTTTINIAMGFGALCAVAYVLNFLSERSSK